MMNKIMLALSFAVVVGQGLFASDGAKQVPAPSKLQMVLQQSKLVAATGCEWCALLSEQTATHLQGVVDAPSSYEEGMTFCCSTCVGYGVYEWLFLHGLCASDVVCPGVCCLAGLYDLLYNRSQSLHLCTKHVQTLAQILAPGCSKCAVKLRASAQPPKTDAQMQ